MDSPLIKRPEITLALQISEASLIEQLQEDNYAVFHSEDDEGITKYLTQRETAVVISRQVDRSEEEVVIDWLHDRRTDAQKLKYLVQDYFNLKPIEIRLTDSIQDDIIAEALAEAYAKHGPKLAEILRRL